MAPRAADRSRVLDAGLRHGRHRHAGRRPRSRVDDELVVQPGGRLVKVRGVQVHGRPSTEAVAGQRTAINLGGVEVGDVSRGETLADAGHAERHAPRRCRDRSAAVDEGAEARRARALAQRHGRSPGPRLDRRRVGRPRSRRAASELVRVRLESPAVLTRGDRFIIRAYSPPITIGGGVVLDPGADAARAFAPRKAGPASSALRIDARQRRGAVAGDDRSGRPRGNRDGRRWSARVGVRAIASRVDAAEARGDAAASSTVGDRTGRRCHRSTKAQDALLALVAASHKANPMSDGLPREEAREKIFARVAPAIFEKVVDDLKAARGAGWCGSAGAADAQGHVSPARTIACERRSSRRIAPAV